MTNFSKQRKLSNRLGIASLPRGVSEELYTRQTQGLAKIAEYLKGKKYNELYQKQKKLAKEVGMPYWAWRSPKRDYIQRATEAILYKWHLKKASEWFQEPLPKEATQLQFLQYAKRQIGRLVIIDGKAGSKIAFNNRPNFPASDEAKLEYVINEAITAVRAQTLLTDRAALQVALTFGYHHTETNRDAEMTKSFNAVRLNEVKDLMNQIHLYNETTNYRDNLLVKIRISIVPENSGGCYSGGQDKILHKADCIEYSFRVKNNNCFFRSAMEELDFKKITKGPCNEIRKEFNIENNKPIPFSVAVEILKKYSSVGFELRDDDSNEYKQTNDEPTQTLKLANGHWTRIRPRMKKKCMNCLKTYFDSHKCNQRVVEYVNRKFRGQRNVLPSKMTAKENDSKYVLHYDIETQTRNELKQHQPYIVGWTHEDSKFHSIGGDDCISKFVDILIEKESEYKKQKRTLVVNAYNGANFDHYKIIAEFVRRGLKFEQRINNGSIILLEYGCLKVMDLCKHMGGESLKKTLSAWKCAVQKGDFDHEKGQQWETMPEEDKAQCLKYLESDVMGLAELYTKFNEALFAKAHVNASQFISTSQLSYALWTKTLGRSIVQLPNMSQQKDWHQAVRAGRCYPSKRRFKSEQYDDYMAGKIKFEDINDYLIDADVVSLYPTAMCEQYPVGFAKECEGVPPTEAKIGIYLIKYKANKNLQHAVGGRRDARGALKWDLQDSEGWYTSVDIEDMIANGYQVEFIRGYYWTETSAVLKGYIEAEFKNKEASEKGTPKYLLAKLMMNSLYGKTLQRPVHIETRLVKTNPDFWKFWGTHLITDIGEPIGDYLPVSGSPRLDETMELQITKPTQVGAFVLAYSRRIMLNYMKEANPYFSAQDPQKRIKHDFYYTDTDSLQMRQQDARKLKNFGKKSLGGIGDDLGDGCKIVRAFWIQPKLYMLEYLKQGDSKLHHHIRGKGVNTASLTVAEFEHMDRGNTVENVRSFQIKKTHLKRSSKQKTAGVPHFGHTHICNIKKVVNQTRFTGRCFIDSVNSVPNLGNGILI